MEHYQHQLKSLLTQVAALDAHYKKINSLTGENFNIFRILKLETSEVRLHSAFLATLLDPKGSHGQKDTFLKLFIDQFCFKRNAIDTTSCEVEIEKHAGFISEDGTEGGRIDIIISDKTSNHIIIENKIYAGDQRHQLTRYHNHSPNADLIYLTLDGKLPSEDSFGILENDTHFKCYSYKAEILTWLEDCRKEVAIFPIVRESITQYINLIKYLTNQTINHSMQKELNSVIKSNLEASFTIYNNLDSALNEILKEFTSQLEDVCEPLGLKCKNKVDFDKRYTGFWISKDEWEYANIGFQFQNYDKDLLFGIAAKHDPEKFPMALRKQLYALPHNSKKVNSWWPWHNYLDTTYANWSKYEAWKAIEDGTMKNVMKQRVELLLQLIGDIKL